MSKLSIKNLCKTYIVNKKQNNVLKNITFEINEGEMVAIMGPSGSGKSTLLYTVSGMDTATAGTIDFFGTELSTVTPNQMSDIRLDSMGFVFQQMHMLKNLSIYDNIILPAYQSKHGQSKEARKAINQPKIVFADEPTGALNQQNSAEVIAELNKINKEGTTIMLVTHDMKVAAKCDRIMYIEDGCIRTEFTLGKFTDETSIKDRERSVTNYLMEMGW